MSYPQPSSNAAVLGGADFFRLNTPLTSPGDIYESEQGSHAFAIGPNSDIANVNVYYYDPTSPASMSSFQISPDRSFVGTINSRITENYQTPTPIPARVLISAADLYNPNWRPDGYVSVGANADSIKFFVPVLDVIQYFSAQPSLVPQRSDKTYEIESVASKGALGAGTGWVVIPAYGRKYASFQFKNGYAGVTLTVLIQGVKLGISDSPAGVSPDVEVPLLTAQIIAAAGTYSYTYQASTDGMFDYFAINYEAGGAIANDFGATTHIIVSDDAL